MTFVLQEEGGLSRDSEDPGGLTNFGISQRAYPTLDIAALTREDAQAIYRRDYWEPYRIGELPLALAVATFDGAVNQGPHAAVKALQRGLGVRADGVIGPDTLQAAQRNLSVHLRGVCVERAVLYASNDLRGLYGHTWFGRLFRCYDLCLMLLDGRP